MTTARDTAGIRFPPPLITLACVLIGIALQRLAPMPVVPEDIRGVARDAGWAIVVLGIALGGWAVGLFRMAKTTPNPLRPTTALVIRGPYTFTRNPMYLGFAIILVGIALVANNLWILLMVIPDVVGTRLMAIDQEERYMSAKFGAPYDEYRARVRRWL